MPEYAALLECQRVSIGTVKADSRLIAVEQRTCQRCFHMANHFAVELLLGLELSGRLTGALASADIVGCTDVIVLLTYFFHAALCGSGMLASTLLISDGPKPVTVLLCLGLVIPAGPTGPLKSVMGAEVLGRRSRRLASLVEVMLGRRDTTQCVCVKGLLQILWRKRQVYVQRRSCLLSAELLLGANALQGSETGLLHVRGRGILAIRGGVGPSLREIL